MLTQEHIYQNEVVALVAGIPKDMQKLGCFKQPKALNLGLREHETKNSLDSVVVTAKHIADIGGIDTVAFGSDVDGFTDPPDDIKNVSQMPHLTAALLGSGFSDPDVEKILGKNMERVLRSGWR